MKNNSISIKLFKITFGLILGLFFITLSFQLLFFEDFYLSHKTKDLVSEVNTFRTMNSYQIYNEKILENALRAYEHSNDSRIAIFSLDGKLKYLANYKSGSDDWESLTSFCAELLLDKELIDGVLSKNKIEWTIFENKSSGQKKIGIVAPMSLQYPNDSIIISVSSIQPIKEASSVIKNFYFYLLLGFVIVAIFLSKIYAQLISKPLIRINQVAMKMSNLDFDAKCEVSDDDEIGSLASTLNFLSENLQSALVDLQQKNLHLEADIEKERNLENMRKDFVASVSHDLKTPIGIISGYAEGLKDGIVSGDDTNLYLQTIIDEATKMNSLVTSMLELSKLESNEVTLSLTSFNIVRLIQVMIRKLNLELKNKSLTVSYVDIPEFAYVYGDILKIEQVIQNLITNAIKYSPEHNEILIYITESKDIVSISIENTGVLIPEKELENIYAKFYKLDKSGDRTKNSYGLGLAIVKIILELHNSSYSISNSSKGVIFTFTLNKS